MQKEDEKIAERRNKQDKRRKQNYNQAKMRGLRISVRPEEMATNERAPSLDMSACETVLTIVSRILEASKYPSKVSAQRKSSCYIVKLAWRIHS
jgi:hypothetical protein